MDSNDLISVIIPVYNVKDYVKESIESVINQTYKNLEIIIIDDGSNDDSEKICDEYAKKDKRIKLIHQKNQGLSAARNKGLDIANGKYISFLDSDDMYYPEMLEKTYNAMINNDVDCVICDYVKGKNKEKTKRLKGRLNIKEDKIIDNKKALNYLIHKKINTSVWNKLYKKELFDNVRFPKGHVHEDIILTMKILKNSNKTYLLNKKLVFYRMNSSSITHTYSKKNIVDLYISHKEYEKEIKENISNLFMERDYYNVCKENLYIYICIYIKNEISNSSEKNEVRKLLKEYISISEKNINMKNISLKRKVIYFMYNHCRWLLVLAYKIYSLGR